LNKIYWPTQRNEAIFVPAMLQTANNALFGGVSLAQRYGKQNQKVAHFDQNAPKQCTCIVMRRFIKHLPHPDKTQKSIAQHT